MPDMETETVTLTEAASRLGVSRDTIREAINLGRLQTVLIGKRRRVTVASITKLIEGEANANQER